MLILKTSSPNVFQVVSRICDEDDYTDVRFADVAISEGFAKIDLVRKVGLPENYLIEILLGEHDFSTSGQGRYYYPRGQQDHDFQTVTNKIELFISKMEEILIKRISEEVFLKNSKEKAKTERERKNSLLMSSFSKIAV